MQAVRSEAQIQADLEAAYVRLEAEAKRRERDPQIQRPCTTCQFYNDKRAADGHEWHAPENRRKYAACRCPLVAGFSKFGVAIGLGRPPMPCGPEKALWRPRLTLWQRILAWLTRAAA